ncbi:hypothetical protein [Xanthomonas arboricola]|uniref:Uncharacterized protein n=2 Tax=Xanthomonas arboricola pv. pruni TaxID=69929 RepID=A0AAP4K6N7_9XANT|nr:hypothetical protein [Xanthomonas arboricola]MDN0268699.1 hypothetical protein [Xanthomonas arboricola pv. pruni]MDN0272816.1 hypothetical protein [Xanthomonas arboricola pv. pruni]MDN0285422.1 hypothetical protein [Xanthomonas arboricola pv. pruni]MDN0289419.1 hypothetical protein [Xanthomonas arboricola pv. pruni]MDN0293484.1 hypothetical protein [Xanthomonas arboricola pv. pruni]
MIKAALPVHCVIAVAAGRAAYVLHMIPGMRRHAHAHAQSHWQGVHTSAAAYKKNDDLFIDYQSLNEIFSTYSSLNIR